MSTLQQYRAGDRVRILTGMAGGTVGAIVSVDRVAGLVNVALDLPVLLSDPDGPKRAEVLPYGPLEVEAVTS